MGLLDVVAQVLGDEGKPLHISDLAARVLDSGLWAGSGKTPDRTIHAQIAVDIKKHGASSRFQRTAKSTFALRAWSLPEHTLRPSSPQPLLPTISVPAIANAPATVSFTDAAEIVLKYCGSETPMHYTDITREALTMDLLATHGRTPEATMYAQILTEINRMQRRGQTPRFTKHGKGLVGLTQWLGTGLQAQISQHNVAVAKKLRAELMAMDPTQFEDLVGAMLVKMGFENVDVTARSNDGGIDVRGQLVIGDAVRISMAVQVKRWKNNVQKPTVQQLRGALGNHEQGLIITIGGFSSGAEQEATRANASPIGLMSGEKLIALLMEYELGVIRTQYDLFELEVTG